ncbi:MAG: hypothetical protein ACTSR2_14835 [Candidatus Hodarchaeales archaeon]
MFGIFKLNEEKQQIYWGDPTETVHKNPTFKHLRIKNRKLIKLGFIYREICKAMI